MAVIVEHRQTRDQFVLLGGGFAAFESKKPSWLLGDLLAERSEGQYAMVCVCDHTGRVGWLESDQVRVVSVDGQPLESVLKPG